MTSLWQDIKANPYLGDGVNVLKGPVLNQFSSHLPYSLIPGQIAIAKKESKHQDFNHLLHGWKQARSEVGFGNEGGISQVLSASWPEPKAHGENYNDSAMKKDGLLDAKPNSQK